MSLEIVTNDITTMRVDAIVNAANEQLAQGGGVCGAIFAAAGARKLTQACDVIGFCKTGGAVLTPGFSLPAKHIIHTVGPVWQGGNAGELELLASCYDASLALANAHGIKSIAFPLISAGIYGVPKDVALRVAITQITRFLEQSEMEVYLVLFSPADVPLANAFRKQIEQELLQSKTDLE